MSAKRLTSLLLALCLAVAMAACGKDDPKGDTPDKEDSGSSQAVAEYPVKLGDVRIEGTPKAVLSLTPATTELLFELGYGGRVIGVSDYCDYPDEVKNKTRCGTALKPDFTAIDSRPVDMVVSSVPLVESDLIRFQQKDIPVLILERSSTLEGIYANYIALATAMEGNVTGAKAGEDFIGGLKAVLQDAEGLANAYTAQHDKPLRAILLREMSYGMATGDTFEQKLFDLLGLKNEAEPYGDWLYLKKDVAALEPDIIFADTSISPDEIIGSVVYKPVAAAKNKRILNVNMAVFERQSPRMFKTVLEMANYAYPAG